MWETIFKIVPPPLFVGFLIYALIVAIWLQPAIEQRMSDLQLIPQCRAGELPAITVGRAAPQSPGPGGAQTTPAVELPLVLQIIMGVRGMTGTTYDPYAGYLRRSGGDACACSTALAFDAVYFKHLGHVMSLRTYHPYDVRNIDERVAVNLASGQCGRN